MGNVPRPNIIWRGAHPNNFTVGRPGGGLDGRNTFHHVVGSAESAVVVFNQPTRGASSHFVITDVPDVIFQCVDINNTAWCDGNWQSNLRTISMEHHGDWRNGYDNPVVRENSAKLVAWLRENYGVNRPVRHRDVIDTTQYPGGTACPGDLPVEAIWNRSTEIINQWNQPVTPPAPEWLANRRNISQKTIYAQKDGLYLYNMNNMQAADSRRFGLNQDFTVTGETQVGDKQFYITKSSMELNISNGILKTEVADTPYVPPVPQPVPTPPDPSTPDWADSLLVDDPNKTMYVLRATPLIDLENGRPYFDVKQNKEIWYQAGDVINDVSAHTIVSGKTYRLTEYSFGNIKQGKIGLANGIAADDLSVDPLSTPPGTPANPSPVPDPDDPPTDMPDVPTTPIDTIGVIATIKDIILKLWDIIKKLGG